jgi:hypothetical protein
MLRLAGPLAAIAVVVAASPAGASCAPPLGVADAIARADVVVVGTVTATRSRDRIATIRIEESWRGAVGGSVEVAGGPATENMATSVDRTYRPGVRYLVIAREPSAHGEQGTFGSRYEDNGCSATRPWTDDLARFRPATATASPTSAPRSTPHPVDVSRRGGPRLGGVVAAAALAAAAAGVVVLLVTRRRSRAG